MKQSEKVLLQLRAAGMAGIHSFELRAQFIGNPSERIRELREQGYEISDRREKLNGTANGIRWWLQAEPTGEVSWSLSPPPGAPPAEGGLFGDDVGKAGPLSPYEADAA